MSSVIILILIAADSAKTDSTHQLVANRVAQCTKNGMPATFQKMVTNHGAPDGINLLGNKKLKPDHLLDIQQPIIDSCCSTVFDEFLQCYGGNTVDGVSSMNDRNKATIYINSNANNTTGVSPHGETHPYLLGKINTLDTGGSYERAVVNGKLAYDNYLQGLVNKATTQAMLWRNSPPETPDRVRQIGLWVADSASLAAKICKSRNVTIVPFTHYCQWKKFVVPPGGQLKVKFNGKSNSCGNASVYKENPATGEKVKVKVWNWNHPGSYRYTAGNDLVISSPSGLFPDISVPVFEPGQLVIRLGDFTLNGETNGFITMIPTELLQMELDSWGIRTTYGFPAPPTTTWLGLVSDSWIDPANWSDGVPGPYHHVIVTPGEGFQPRLVIDASVWSITLMEGASINTAPGAYLTVSGQ